MPRTICEDDLEIDPNEIFRPKQACRYFGYEISQLSAKVASGEIEAPFPLSPSGLRSRLDRRADNPPPPQARRARQGKPTTEQQQARRPCNDLTRRTKGPATTPGLSAFLFHPLASKWRRKCWIVLPSLIRNIALPSPSLSDLAEAIRAEHAAVVSALRGAVEHAIRCGKIFADAKEQTGHGRWTEFLRTCGIGERTGASTCSSPTWPSKTVPRYGFAEQNGTGGI